MKTNTLKTTRVSKIVLPGSSGHAITASGWVTTDNAGCLFLAYNHTTAVYAAIPITGLCVGDKIKGFRVVGAMGGGSGQASVLNVSLVKATKGTGTSGSTLVQAATALSKEADYSLDDQTVLTATEIIADDYQYYFLVKGTAANNSAADISISSIEVDVIKSFGLDA
jgi:hypothetical protein